MTKIPKDIKISIRCKEDKTRTDFKRIAADFHNSEDVIKWVALNYPRFRAVAPPFYPPRGEIL